MITPLSENDDHNMFVKDPRICLLYTCDFHNALFRCTQQVELIVRENTSLSTWYLYFNKERMHVLYQLILYLATKEKYLN